MKDLLQVRFPVAENGWKHIVQFRRDERCILFYCQREQGKNCRYNMRVNKIVLNRIRQGSDQTFHDGMISVCKHSNLPQQFRLTREKGSNDLKENDLFFEAIFWEDTSQTQIHNSLRVRGGDGVYLLQVLHKDNGIKLICLHLFLHTPNHRQKVAVLDTTLQLSVGVPILYIP